jgi:Kef-type K+ transport system membrane component KefB
MKFFWALLVYLLAGLVLAWAILQAAYAGKPAMLITFVVVYCLGLGYIGCLPKKTH